MTAPVSSVICPRREAVCAHRGDRARRNRRRRIGLNRLWYDAFISIIHTVDGGRMEHLEPYMNSLIFDAHLDLSMNAMEWNREIGRASCRERVEGWVVGRS